MSQPQDRPADKAEIHDLEEFTEDASSREYQHHVDQAAVKDQRDSERLTDADQEAEDEKEGVAEEVEEVEEKRREEADLG